MLSTDYEDPCPPFLAAVTVSALSAFGAPDPGLYAGVLTVKKILPVEGLSSTFTLKAQARVTADGQIVVLPTVAESPAAAANPQSTVVRAVPVPEQTSIRFPEDPPLPPNNYVVEGQHPGFVTVAGGVLKLTCETGRDTTGNVLDIRTPYTVFSFVARKQRQ